MSKVREKMKGWCGDAQPSPRSVFAVCSLIIVLSGLAASTATGTPSGQTSKSEQTTHCRDQASDWCPCTEDFNVASIFEIDLPPQPAENVIEYILEIKRFNPSAKSEDVIFYRRALSDEDFPHLHRGTAGYYMARVDARTSAGLTTIHTQQVRLGQPGYPSPPVPSWRSTAVGISDQNMVDFSTPSVPKSATTFHQWEIQVKCLQGTSQASRDIDYANWMAQVPGVMTLTVDEMAWPGTHDTGAYNRKYLSDNYPIPASGFTQHPWYRAFAESGFTTPSISELSPWVIDELFQNITITHPNSSVYQMLIDGVRYLDLRIARSINKTDRTYYLVHEFVVEKLTTSLTDILLFVETHPKEVIFIKVQPKFQIDSDAEQRQAMQFIEDFRSPTGKTIRDYSFVKTVEGGKNYSQCGTIGDLVKSGKRLLLTWQSRFGVPPAGPTIWFFWKEAFYTDRWRQANSVTLKHQYLAEDIYQKAVSPNNGKVYNVQFILTPKQQDMVWDSENWQQFSVGVQQSVGMPSLRVLADEMNPTLGAFLYVELGKAQRNFTNIFTVDFYHEYRDSFFLYMRALIEERVRDKRARLGMDCDGSWHTTTTPLTTKRFHFPGRLLEGSYELRTRAVGSDGKSSYSAPLMAAVPAQGSPGEGCSNLYACSNGFQCLPTSMRCDGTADCLGSSDEENCPIPAERKADVDSTRIVALKERIRQLEAEQQQCHGTRGVINWSYKQWHRHRDGSLKSFQIPYQKQRNDTFLHLTWSSNLAFLQGDTCILVSYVNINGSPCTDPGPINAMVSNTRPPAGSVSSAQHLAHYRKSTVTGICRSTDASSKDVLKAGKHIISTHISLAGCGVSVSGLSLSQVTTSNTVIIEELCPPL